MAIPKEEKMQVIWPIRQMALDCRCVCAEVVVPVKKRAASCHMPYAGIEAALVCFLNRMYLLPIYTFDLVLNHY